MSDFQANSPETIWLPEFGGSWLSLIVTPNQTEQMHTNANTRNLKVTRGWRILLRLAALVQMCQLRRSTKKAVTKRDALVGTLIQDPQGTHVPVSRYGVALRGTLVNRNQRSSRRRGSRAGGRRRRRVYSVTPSPRQLHPYNFSIQSALIPECTSWYIDA